MWGMRFQMMLRIMVVLVVVVWISKSALDVDDVGSSDEEDEG